LRAAAAAERIINHRRAHASTHRENLFSSLVLVIGTKQIEHEREHEHDYEAAVCLSFVTGLIRFARMNKTVIEVQVRAVLPTSGGCAVFLGNNDKVFIIYVDQTVGSAITMFMRDVSKERPLTHDLMGHLMTALGAKVERVIINDLKNATYYARMIIRAENELQQKKIIELDGRPSDCIAMATQQKAPMYVSQEVWDEVDDMSDVLRKMEEEGIKPDVEPESESESTEEE
jgi:bifunctional DNase/RNase